MKFKDRYRGEIESAGKTRPKIFDPKITKV